MNNVHYMSETVEWETPQDLFDELNAEFDLYRDACANALNKKRKLYWSKEDDGLAQDWTGMRLWLNPPYGREVGKWVEKAANSEAEIVVALLPARTDTKWFHQWIYNKETVEIRFIKGRLKFGGSKNSAPFPSMIVIFKP